MFGPSRAQKKKRRFAPFGGPGLKRGLALFGGAARDLDGTMGHGNLQRVQDRFRAEDEQEQLQLQVQQQQQQAQQALQAQQQKQAALLQQGQSAGLSQRELIALQTNPEAYGKAAATGAETRVINDQLVAPGGGQALGDYRSPITLGQGETAVNPATGGTVASVAPKPTRTFEQELQLRSAGANRTTVNNSTGGPAPSTPFEKKRDEGFAQTYIDWTSGGGADAVAQISKIKDVVARIDAGENLTGPEVGFTPKVIRALAAPGTVDAQEVVEEVVQRNLRLILGAQFTAQEGERLISRAYNPTLDEPANRKRLVRLFTQMETAAQQTQAMAQHVEQNGTLAGFQGTTPNMQQFFDALDEDGGGGNAPVRRRYNPNTGEFE